jgi:hypothetical protein
MERAVHLLTWCFSQFGNGSVWKDGDSKIDLEAAKYVITAQSNFELNNDFIIFIGVPFESTSHPFYITYGTDVTLYSKDKIPLFWNGNHVTSLSKRQHILTIYITHFNDSLRWFDYLRPFILCGAISIHVLNRGPRVLEDSDFIIHNGVENVGLNLLDIVKICSNLLTSDDSDNSWHLFTQTIFSDHVSIPMYYAILRLLEGGFDGYDLLALSRPSYISEQEWSGEIHMSDQYKEYSKDDGTFQTCEGLFNECGMKKIPGKKYLYAEGPIICVKKSAIVRVPQTVFDTLYKKLETRCFSYIIHVVERIIVPIIEDCGAKILLMCKNVKSEKRHRASIVQREPRTVNESRLAAFNETYALLQDYTYMTVTGKDPEPEIIEGNTSAIHKERIACVALGKAASKLISENTYNNEWLFFIGENNVVASIASPVDIVTDRATYENVIISANKENSGNAVFLKMNDSTMSVLSDWFKSLSLNKSLLETKRDDILLLHDSIFSSPPKYFQEIPITRLCLQKDIYLPQKDETINLTVFDNTFKFFGRDYVTFN